MNLILGAIKGYGHRDLWPFLSSLSATGYSEEVCLFYQDVSQADLDAVSASSHPFRLELRPFQSFRIRLGPKTLYPFAHQLRALHWMYPSLVSLAGHNQTQRYRVAAAMQHVWTSRYFLYHDYLSARPGTFERVLITDVRDVIFQRNPFQYETSDALLVFEERAGRDIALCPFNSVLVQCAVGNSALSDIAGRNVSCSGVTMGTQSAMLHYLQQMCEVLRRLKSYTGGVDQGVHNYLLHTGQLPSARLMPNRYAPVFTMSFEDGFKFNDLGQLVDDSGEVFHIVHQYDRFPEIASRLELQIKTGFKSITT